MAAPTVSLYVPTVSATRMAPCPVSARLDLGAENKSIRNGTYTWSTVNTGTTTTHYTAPPTSGSRVNAGIPVTPGFKEASKKVFTERN